MHIQSSDNNCDLKALIAVYRDQALIATDTADKLQELLALREEIGLYRDREACQIEELREQLTKGETQ